MRVEQKLALIIHPVLFRLQWNFLSVELRCTSIMVRKRIVSGIGISRNYALTLFPRVNLRKHY